eukprot:11127432-Ditylum_brightwellii.AAC.1
MHSLPNGWDMTDMENLTTKARQYLATIVSNRKHNKHQWNIIKNEIANKNKPTTDKKRTTGNLKGNKDCTPSEPHQKEILKEIQQGKHTATCITCWKEQTTSEVYYYHKFKHANSICYALGNAFMKEESNAITQGAPGEQMAPEPSTEPEDHAVTPTAYSI